jgi:hypothetical protein
MRNFDKRALKESVSDTAIAIPLNVFLNWVFLTVFLAWGMSAFQISIALTVVFTILAIIRKYYVRVWFKKNESETAKS